MTATATIEEIRAQGFTWPRYPEIEQNAVVDGGRVDLDATLAKLESSLAFYDREIRSMHDFARKFGARVEDITDNREAHGERRVAFLTAVQHLKAVREALLKGRA